MSVAKSSLWNICDWIITVWLVPDEISGLDLYPHLHITDLDEIALFLLYLRVCLFFFFKTWKIYSSYMKIYLSYMTYYNSLKWFKWSCYPCVNVFEEKNYCLFFFFFFLKCGLGSCSYREAHCRKAVLCCSSTACSISINAWARGPSNGWFLISLYWKKLCGFPFIKKKIKKNEMRRAFVLFFWEKRLSRLKI